MSGFGVLLHELFYHLMHQSGRVDLAFMGSKRGDANPFFEVVLHVHSLGQQVQVSSLTIGEDALELDVYGIAQLLENLNVVFEGCGLLFQSF